MRLEALLTRKRDSVSAGTPSLQTSGWMRVRWGGGVIYRGICVGEFLITGKLGGGICSLYVFFFLGYEPCSGVGVCGYW